jgi:hypothetical protein
MRTTLAVLFVLTLIGCTEPGRTRVSMPVHGAGTGTRTFTSEGWDVTITEARLAFGPAYFCTTPFADVDLCPEALAEVRSVASFDALDPTPQMLGELDGISGTMRSTMFDYGISWLLPAPAPEADPNAVDGAHSLHLAATAVRGATTVRFVVDLDVVPRNGGVDGAHGVPVVHTLTGAPDALTIRADPAAWLATAPLDELESASGDPVVLGEDSAITQALLIAMVTGTPVAFEWARAD